MILQALYDYYKRKAADPESNIAPRGFEWKEIPFIIVLDKDGNFQFLKETSEGSGKDKKAIRYLVLKSKGRSGSSSWQTVNCFWDHFGYVLAQPKNVKKDSELEKAVADAARQNGSFVDEVRRISQMFPDNKEFRAVASFYENPDNMLRIKEDGLWDDLTGKDGTNLSFQVIGSDSIVAEHSDIAALLNDDKADGDGTAKTGICLITGEKAPIAVLHTATSLPGGKSGGKIVGFQRGSGYDSYYKEQGANAPVSLDAEDAYTTALNVLLGKDSRNKYRMGDTTVLFWAQKHVEFEDDFPYFFSSPPKDDPDKAIDAVRNVMGSVYSGALADGEHTPFYILGLAPNAARISIRFWHAGTVGEFARNIRQHFEDLQIVRSRSDEREFFSLFNLLTQVSFDYKLDNLPPNLMGDMMQSIIENRPYPATLQIHCLNRINADRSIGRIRAAILKAYLNRKLRLTNYSQQKHMTMDLDLENKNQGYLCGRLFAVLERIQGAAMPGINANIRDRFYTAASTRPRTVYTNLISLAFKHLDKMNGGLENYYMEKMKEIMRNIDSYGFPKQLSADDQSAFVVGYFHQLCDGFSKRGTEE